MISTPRPSARPHNRGTSRAPGPAGHATEPVGGRRSPIANCQPFLRSAGPPPDTGPPGAAAPDARTTQPHAAATPPAPHATRPAPLASTPIPSRTKTSDIHHQALLTMRDGEGAPRL